MKTLPTQKCPHTQRKDCNLCGRWLGWIDLSDPARLPTEYEWGDACKKIQDNHDKLRIEEFNKLSFK